VGKNHVIANDILPSMIDGVTDCVRHMKARDIECDVEPLLVDMCKIDLPKGSLDGIYSLQAIEHVHDLELMFQRCANLLKPGGRFVIINDCNILTPSLRDEMM